MKGLLSTIAGMLLATMLSTAASGAELAGTTGDYVGHAVCMGCHQQAASHWSHTLHAKVFVSNPRNELQARRCEACHGPGSEHLKNPADKQSIVRFSHQSERDAAEQNEMCLACHDGGQRIHWMSSIHERNDLVCSDCHNPMAQFSVDGLLAKPSISETCFGCHRQQRADFNKRSHMPLPEGQLSCVDCHNPHGSTTDPLLRTDTVNETCYQCHAEKRGPFIWEHAPVREDCTNCHNTHGSNHEKLLITARPILCQQCHTMIGHMNDLLTRGQLASGSNPDVRLLARSCSTCHAQIHGSNHPAGVKFLR